MLYIVGTPIGNIKEITLRAIEVLNAVDFIAAEDTRRTAILLNEYDIKKPMISYQKFNERSSAQKLIEILGQGKDVALVSDAGMPLISDPGQLLTQELIKNNLAYTVVGGPCALIDALLLSGLDASRFCMLGFLPEKKSDRDKLLADYSDVKCTLIFYSAVHNVDKDLSYLYEAYGSRSVAVVREISKLYEEVVRGKLGDVLEFVRKGEFVLVVEGAPERDYSELSVLEHYEMYVRNGLNKKDAIKKVASDRNVSKSEIYQIVVNANND
ncbi:MAG: 16S rRNA (cytidine(1402)-2'-O)-methyltransferase [Clostridiales bacterium]|nr:16S rRNA (cytidine(1402)-2'-O)-methyltransferase [Clostridiales bacterium]